MILLEAKIIKNEDDLQIRFTSKVPISNREATLQSFILALCFPV